MRAISHETRASRGRLLVVEDDLVQRTVIGKVAAKIGYDTVTASTFDIAVRLLRQECFDAVTLDLSLGEHDGIELLRLVAELGLHSMPVVVISGCDDRVMNSTRRVAEGLKLSLVASLSKPLNLDNLREALYRPRQTREEPGRPGTQHINRAAILAGMARNEFSVEFQPKVTLESGKVAGAEALARWRSPDLGTVSPALFIPAAEQLGLMTALTDHILSAAIAQGRDLVEEHPGLAIAVNIPGSRLDDLMLPERIERMLRSSNLDPESLIVEVTESIAMSDVDRAMDILVRLRLKGIGAAIDDFGTGYSSLAALARLPFSELKIDQSFVRNCDTDTDMIKIVEASIGLAHAFNMKVVAEGIDRPELLVRLRQAGCDIGQGHLFSPALRSESFKGWLKCRESARRTGGEDRTEGARS